MTAERRPLGVVFDVDEPPICSTKSAKVSDCSPATGEHELGEDSRDAYLFFPSDGTDVESARTPDLQSLLA